MSSLCAIASNKASAGGQELQPWLVNSSTTPRGCVVSAATATPPNNVATSVAAMRIDLNGMCLSSVLFTTEPTQFHGAMPSLSHPWQMA